MTHTTKYTDLVVARPVGKNRGCDGMEFYKRPDPCSTALVIWTDNPEDASHFESTGDAEIIIDFLHHNDCPNETLYIMKVETEITKTFTLKWEKMSKRPTTITA